MDIDTTLLSDKKNIEPITIHGFLRWGNKQATGMTKTNESPQLTKENKLLTNMPGNPYHSVCEKTIACCRNSRVTISITNSLMISLPVGRRSFGNSLSVQNIVMMQALLNEKRLRRSIINKFYKNVLLLFLQECFLNSINHYSSITGTASNGI